MEEVRITTVDNPFNPFTEWDEWFNFDLQKGYRTCEQLASITFLSDQLSDSENNETEINLIFVQYLPSIAYENWRHRKRWFYC